MAKIVGVKFKNAGKVYYFTPTEETYAENEGVIVETARGVEYGTVAIPPKDVPDGEITQPLKPIIRKASEEDEKRREKNESKKAEALKTAEEKVQKHDLKMKLIDCEFTFDGSKVVFYFTAEGRIDFRELVRDLASAFKIRIELRQVGIRDEAKLLGGIAPCGRPCCCSSYLQDFKKVSIKMAKTQGLSLNPSKISGLCGRLMCCLEYENGYYSEIYKKMPKIGSEVKTKDGSGMVIANNMLKLLVKIKFENADGSLLFKEYPLDQIQATKTMSEDENDAIDESVKELIDD